MKKENYTLTIDPGVSGTGFAIWEGVKQNMVLVDCGNIYACSDLKEWDNKVKSICETLRFRLFYPYTFNDVYIEMPQKFQGVSGDMVANSGDLVKLTLCAGFIAGYIYANYDDLPLEFIPVNIWKGQLSKDVVKRRVIKKLGDTYNTSKIKSHSFDAIGLGLYVKGVF